MPARPRAGRRRAPISRIRQPGSIRKKCSNKPSTSRCGDSGTAFIPVDLLESSLAYDDVAFNSAVQDPLYSDFLLGVQSSVLDAAQNVLAEDDDEGDPEYTPPSNHRETDAQYSGNVPRKELYALYQDLRDSGFCRERLDMIIPSEPAGKADMMNQPSTSRGLGSQSRPRDTHASLAQSQSAGGSSVTEPVRPLRGENVVRRLATPRHEDDTDRNTFSTSCFRVPQPPLSQPVPSAQALANPDYADFLRKVTVDQPPSVQRTENEDDDDADPEYTPEEDLDEDTLLFDSNVIVPQDELWDLYDDLFQNGFDLDLRPPSPMLPLLDGNIQEEPAPPSAMDIDVSAVMPASAIKHSEHAARASQSSQWPMPPPRLRSRASGRATPMMHDIRMFRDGAATPLRSGKVWRKDTTNPPPDVDGTGQGHQGITQTVQAAHQPVADSLLTRPPCQSVVAQEPHGMARTSQPIKNSQQAIGEPVIQLQLRLGDGSSYVFSSSAIASAPGVPAGGQAVTRTPERQRDVYAERIQEGVDPFIPLSPTLDNYLGPSSGAPARTGAVADNGCDVDVRNILVGKRRKRHPATYTTEYSRPECLRQEEAPSAPLVGADGENLAAHMTPFEVSQLQKQLRMHVQLLAQMHVMTKGLPKFEQVECNTKTWLEHFADAAAKSCVGPERTAMRPVNLSAALDLTKDPGPVDDDDIRPWKHSCMKRIHHTCSYSHGIRVYDIRMLAESRACIYPELMPIMAPCKCGEEEAPDLPDTPTLEDLVTRVKEKNPRFNASFSFRAYHPAEDNLLVMGLDQVEHLRTLKGSFNMFHRYNFINNIMLPCRSGKSLHMRAECMMKEDSVSSPIAFWRKERKIPQVARLVEDVSSLNLEEMKSPKDWPLEDQPLWLTCYERGCLFRLKRKPHICPLRSHSSLISALSVLQRAQPLAVTQPVLPRNTGQPPLPKWPILRLGNARENPAIEASSATGEAHAPEKSVKDTGTSTRLNTFHSRKAARRLRYERKRAENAKRKAVFSVTEKKPRRRRRVDSEWFDENNAPNGFMDLSSLMGGGGGSSVLIPTNDSRIFVLSPQVYVMQHGQQPASASQTNITTVEPASAAVNVPVTVSESVGGHSASHLVHLDPSLVTGNELLHQTTGKDDAVIHEMEPLPAQTFSVPRPPALQSTASSSIPGPLIPSPQPLVAETAFDDISMEHDAFRHCITPDLSRNAEIPDDPCPSSSTSAVRSDAAGGSLLTTPPLSNSILTTPPFCASVVAGEQGIRVEKSGNSSKVPRRPGILRRDSAKRAQILSQSCSPLRRPRTSPLKWALSIQRSAKKNRRKSRLFPALAETPTPERKQKEASRVLGDRTPPQSLPPDSAILSNENQLVGDPDEFVDAMLVCERVETPGDVTSAKELKQKAAKRKELLEKVRRRTEDPLEFFKLDGIPEIFAQTLFSQLVKALALQESKWAAILAAAMDQDSDASQMLESMVDILSSDPPPKSAPKLLSWLSVFLTPKMAYDYGLAEFRQQVEYALQALALIASSDRPHQKRIHAKSLISAKTSDAVKHRLRNMVGKDQGLWWHGYKLGYLFPDEQLPFVEPDEVRWTDVTLGAESETEFESYQLPKFPPRETCSCPCHKLPKLAKCPADGMCGSACTIRFSGGNVGFRREGKIISADIETEPLPVQETERNPEEVAGLEKRFSVAEVLANAAKTPQKQPSDSSLLIMPENSMTGDILRKAVCEIFGDSRFAVETPGKSDFRGVQGQSLSSTTQKPFLLGGQDVMFGSEALEAGPSSSQNTRMSLPDGTVENPQDGTPTTLPKLESMQRMDLGDFGGI